MSYMKIKNAIKVLLDICRKGYVVLRKSTTYKEKTYVYLIIYTK